jgi:hypothetical protein
LKLSLRFPLLIASATISFFSNAESPLFTAEEGPFFTVNTGNNKLLAELGSGIRDPDIGMLATVASLDGLGARLLVPARLGARAGPPDGSGWGARGGGVFDCVTVDGVLVFPAAAPPTFLEVPARLAGRWGTDFVELGRPVSAMTVLVVEEAVVECMGWGNASFSFCLFDAGPRTDEAVELVDIENAVLAWEDPDIDRIDGVADIAAETLRDIAGAGVIDRPTLEFVRGR